MGLAERRAVADYQAKSFPNAKKEVDDAAGFPVTMEVRWNTLEVPNQAANDYAELFQKSFFTPLVAAIKSIAVDDMGRDALKGALKKVVIDGSEGHSASYFSFNDGVLEVKHDPNSNFSDVEERTKGIQKLLEEKL